MRKDIYIAGKKLEKPIFQGGMGVGVSLYKLAANVALCGGVGIISAAQIGFLEDDFETNAFSANLRAININMQKARQISKEGIIGFNIMVALQHYEDYVKECVKAGADIIVSGAGLPMDLPKYVEGSDCAIAPIVSGEKAASVILRYWDKKYNRIPDVLIIEGPKAGGHLGFSLEELSDIENTDYNITVKNILEVVKKYEEKYSKSIPVVLGGGIYSNEEAKKAFATGVDAIQVATRFITTYECDASDNYKNAFLNVNKDDVIIVKSPVGMPGRAIKNTFIKSVSEGKKYTPDKCYGCIKTCNPKETPYCITKALINAVKGDIDNGLLFTGAKVYENNKIVSVKEVIDELLLDI